jgi:transcriptional regulator with XRE-family HTH domain/predicted RNase H-like HicB family nuclease
MSSHRQIGSLLRYLRRARGLSQERLGELSGIHATNIGRIERGQAEATLETLVALAIALQLEPDYLVGHTVPGVSRLAITPGTGVTAPRPLSVQEGGEGTTDWQGSPPPEFIVVIQRTRDGYSAHVPDLPGCTARGDTPQGAEAGIRKAGNDHVQGLRRAGRPIPSSDAYALVMAFEA